MHICDFLLLASVGLVTSISADNSLFDPNPAFSIASYTNDEAQEVSKHGELVDRGVDGRCGPNFGKCWNGYCCSSAGYCGNTQDHCRSPDCLIDFGHCDAHRTPDGPPTKEVPRPHVGNAQYGPFVVRSCTVPGTVALTYDDGPYKYTSELLDLLDEYNAKATFFVTGINNGKGQIDDFSLAWAELIQRMWHSGHQIASHTWSHQDLSRIKKGQRRDQILKNEAALRNILGGFPTYMRPPYSSCSVESGCLSDMGELGYHIVLFDLDTDDYNNDKPEAIQKSKERFDYALSNSKASDKSWLAIAHDVHEQTVRNLTVHMLREIRDHGYRAVTVGDCIGDPKEFWYRQDSRSSGGKKGPPKSAPKGKHISHDGTCGKNATCIGSAFGPCCSSANLCGNSTQHCGNGCQTDAGHCSTDNATLTDIPKTKGRPGDGSPTGKSKGGDKKASEAGSLIGNLGLTLAGAMFISFVTTRIGQFLFGV